MSAHTEMTAGGMAGAAGTVATQPLDTIRIRLQSCTSRVARGGHATGLFDCLTQVLRDEGPRGLYKGVVTPTMTVGVMNAVSFVSNEFSSALLRRHYGMAPGEQLSLPQAVLAGMTSGLTTAPITSPTEMVKCLAQTNTANKGNFTEEFHIFRRMVSAHGMWGAHGPWRGLSLTFLRDVPSLGIYFGVYEAMTRRFGKSAGSCFVSGGFAGSLSWAVIYPVDVIKTRWQTAAPGVYRSVGHCVQVTVARDGCRALSRGFAATMLRAWPQNGVVFCTYELLTGLLTGST